MATKKAGGIYIGTSNIVIPGNKQSFPDAFKEKSRLNYYASLFDSVEINSSFYKMPLPATFQKWANDVPGNFQFSIKLWRDITHVKELKFKPGDVEIFLNAADKAGNTKGPLLIQFPGKINIDYYSQVAALLEQVRLHNAINKRRIAVEFRNTDWYVCEAMELLDEYDASLVLHDIPKSKNTQLNKKAKFVYFRFHGTNGDYRGSYSNEALKEYAKKIKQRAKQGKDVYAYFNNTIGSAFENARTLKKMCS
ncbi:MAG: DUF72 domain-containing protein [Rhizobacter sp.]|nr:DUF72 domain-containing protein [Ferruginibacter sp.]